MTEKNTTADLTQSLVEKAKAELTEQEFVVYITHFNLHNAAFRLQTSGAFEPEFVQFFTNTIAMPLAILTREHQKVERARDHELHARAFEDFRAAMAAAEIKPDPTFEAIMTRAKAEGFKVPTWGNYVALQAAGKVDWQGVFSAERFHFQKLVAGLCKNKIPAQYLIASAD